MQYTLPDIMYDVNHILSHASSPFSPSFQRIKHLIHYLASCPHRPIMYPSGFDGTTTHEFRQDVSPGDFCSQNISNGLVAFSDGEEGRAPNERRTISCIILFFLVLILTGHKNPNQPMHPITHAQKFTHFT